MRGKIVSVLLIAVFFVSLIVNLPFAYAPVTSTMLYLEPTLVTGNPGETFTVGLFIDKATDVYAWEVVLKYPPYRSVLVPTKVTEGPFLAAGGYTFFASSDNPFDGELLFGATLMAGVPGVSGSGLLATVEFFVIEAGYGGLELIETAIIDSNLQPIDHQSRDSYYQGPAAQFVRKELPLGRDRQVGDMQQFNVKIRNPSDVPLKVYVLWDMSRLEDGAHDIIGSGQWFYGFGPLPFYWEPDLYVDGYSEWWERWDPPYNWKKVGDTPWLNAKEDGNYIYAEDYHSNGAITARYTFDDIRALEDKEMINRVILEGYTWSDNINIDLDMYTVTPTTFDWLGSLWGTETWGWHTPRWIDPDEYVNVLCEPAGTEAGLNDISLLCYHYSPGADFDGTMMCDALRLRVEVTQRSRIPDEPPVFTIEPGTATLDLDPATMGPLTEYDVGTYLCSATLYYSYYGTWFSQAEKVQTFKWFVTEG